MGGFSATDLVDTLLFFMYRCFGNSIEDKGIAGIESEYIMILDIDKRGCLLYTSDAADE